MKTVSDRNRGGYWSDEETKVFLDINIHLCFDRIQQWDADVYKNLRGEMFVRAAAHSALPGILVSANLVSSLKSPCTAPSSDHLTALPPGLFAHNLYLRCFELKLNF